MGGRVGEGRREKEEGGGERREKWEGGGERGGRSGREGVREEGEVERE